MLSTLWKAYSQCLWFDSSRTGGNITTGIKGPYYKIISAVTNSSGTTVWCYPGLTLPLNTMEVAGTVFVLNQIHQISIEPNPPDYRTLKAISCNSIFKTDAQGEIHNTKMS